MNRNLLARAVAVLVFFAGAPAWGMEGTEGTEGLEAGGAARVVAVVDGDTLWLDDGAEVRLVGIQAPKLALGRRDFRPWPLAEEAKAALEALTLERRARLFYGGRRGDRHGRVLAHLFLDDGTWVQGALLLAGMARVYSFADNRARVNEMLALEARARRARAGIWAHRFYDVRRADHLDARADGFQLVEGMVANAAVVRGRVYLNFGEDWKSDFTVTVAPRDRRLFDDAGIDTTRFAGARLRVRGGIKQFNGPMIEVTHPEQIERLD